MANIVMITGCPGTGKSYLANLLLERFSSLELHSYDTLKEAYWDRYGFDNPVEKYRNCCCSLQQYYAELALRMLQQVDLLIEYPFHLGHKAVLQKLVETYGYTAVTICMYGQMDVIYHRGMRRNDGGHRHPGHLCDCYHLGDTVDSSSPAGANSPPAFAAFLADCSQKNYNIQLGYNIAVDVTDYATVDYNLVLEQVRLACDWHQG